MATPLSRTIHLKSEVYKNSLCPHGSMSWKNPHFSTYISTFWNRVSKVNCGHSAFGSYLFYPHDMHMSCRGYGYKTHGKRSDLSQHMGNFWTRVHTGCYGLSMDWKKLSNSPGKMYHYISQTMKRSYVINVYTFG